MQTRVTIGTKSLVNRHKTILILATLTECQKCNRNCFQKTNMGKPVWKYFVTQTVLIFATAVQYGKQIGTVKGQRGNKAKDWITLNCNVKRTWKLRLREFILFNRERDVTERNTN